MPRSYYNKQPPSLGAFCVLSENVVRLSDNPIIVVLYIKMCLYLQYQKRYNIMKNINTEKLERVENTDAEFLSYGIIAFQLVKFTLNFYGNLVEDILDTKIMSDGRQIVIDGNGFIAAGFEI